MTFRRTEQRGAIVNCFYTQTWRSSKVTKGRQILEKSQNYRHFADNLQTICRHCARLQFGKSQILGDLHSAKGRPRANMKDEIASYVPSRTANTGITSMTCFELFPVVSLLSLQGASKGVLATLPLLVSPQKVCHIIVGLAKYDESEQLGFSAPCGPRQFLPSCARNRINAAHFYAQSRVTNARKLLELKPDTGAPVLGRYLVGSLAFNFGIFDLQLRDT